MTSVAGMIHPPSSSAFPGKASTPPLKILHLITTLEAGGAEVMLSRLLSALDPDLFTSRVVCMAGPGEIGRQIAASGIPVSYLGFRLGRVSFSGTLRWLSLLRRHRPDVLQSWMYHANLLSLSAPLVSPRIRLFWNIQASERDPSGFKPLTRIVIGSGRWFSRVPEAVIVNSQKGAADHRRMGYRKKSLHCIPNGFDLSLFVPLSEENRRQVRRSLGVEDQTPCVGMFARYHPVKDHAAALLAARHVKGKGVKAHFFFAGAGVGDGNAALGRLVSQLDLDSSVHFLGYRKDVPKLMAAMDTVISCSRSEGFSNVIGEAMAAGVPCVVTDVGDSARVVGDTGKAVPPQNPESLAQALLQILGLPDGKRRSLGRKARNRIERQFSIQKIAEAYAGLYRRPLSVYQAQARDNP